MKQLLESKCVDILMATYNGEKYIRQQLDSILAQTHSNFNLLIADDGSTDSTVEILQHYHNNDPRIKLIINQKNMGVIKNYEQLISFSDADYFMLCDQDDVWFEHKIEKSLLKIVNTGALLVYSDLSVTDNKLNIIHRSYFKSQRVKPVKNNAWKILLVQNIVTGCTIIASNKIKKYSIPIPENVSMHDSWLAFVGSIYGRVEYIEEPLLYYRQHTDNVIGADDRLKRWGIEGFSYPEYIKRRNNHCMNHIQKLTDYSKAIKNEKVVRKIHYLISCYQKYLRIQFLDIRGRAILHKIRFPSQGITRNIWWVLYYQFPIICFLILQVKNKAGNK